MFIPLLEGLDIAADALLTQRKLARYWVEQRAAHHLFTAKDNQPNLAADIRLFFQNRGEPEPLALHRGRLELRATWTTNQSQRAPRLPLRPTSLRHRAPQHRQKDRQGVH